MPRTRNPELQTVEYNGRRYTRKPEARYFYCNEWDKERQKYTYRSLHRDVWEHANQMRIPEGYHIHHIDGNVDNNVPENLQCVSPSEHWKLHEAAHNQHCKQHTLADPENRKRALDGLRKWFAETADDPNVKAMRSERGRKSWESRTQEKEFSCETCKQTFVTRGGKTAKFCSRRCYEASRPHRPEPKREITCKNCQKSFMGCRRARFCSRSCAAEFRRRASL